jgi:hypothetical protein
MRIIFEIAGTEYTIPDLTVYDWYHVQDELILNPYAGFSIISYLSECPEEELKEMNVDDWSELWEVTQKFMTDQSQSNLFPDKTYKFNGTKYTLVNPDTMTIGQFADLDILINSPGSEKKIHEVMASLYYPITKEGAEEYDTDKVNARAKEFIMVPLKDAVRALNFFLLSGQQYLNNILDYLNSIDLETETPEIKEILQMTQRRLLEVGTLLSSSSQEETSPKWITSQNSRYVLLSTGSPSSKTKQENKNSKIKKFYQNIKNN